MRHGTGFAPFFGSVAGGLRGEISASAEAVAGLR